MCIPLRDTNPSSAYRNLLSPLLLITQISYVMQSLTYFTEVSSPDGVPDQKLGDTCLMVQLLPQVTHMHFNNCLNFKT